nr:hypothetical protein [Tanacetum cinerariifolium]
MEGVDRINELRDEMLVNNIISHEDDITDFGCDDTDYVAFIDNTLNECPTDLNLKKFKLNINNDNRANYEFKSRADSWIRYPISRNVEEIDLWFWDEGVGSPFCSYDDELFFNTSCITHCYGYTRIDVTSKSVKKLVFSKHYSDDELFEKDYIDHITINVPYISSLTIKGCSVNQPRESEWVLLDFAILGVVAAKQYLGLREGMKELNVTGM